MDALIWIGAAISCIGLAGLISCIVIATRAKRACLDDAALRKKLKSVVSLNLGALLLSAMGLMCVVVGVMLT